MKLVVYTTTFKLGEVTLSVLYSKNGKKQKTQIKSTKEVKYGIRTGCEFTISNR